jgi:hypothetical protein
LFGEKLRLLPNVPSMGIEDNILDGIVTGLLHKLQVIKRELTADPTGVIVESTEIDDVFTEGNVPVANPRILLICEEEVESTI